ncbi:MAG: MBOAT family protein [Oscillospiraceae bacterium]|nr:MBOAT family protein [Oscillospiraceae bacterium]
MLFTSYTFLLFLAVVLTACWLCPPRFRWRLTLAASVVFYAWLGWSSLAYLAVTVALAYVAGRLMGRLHAQREAFLSASADRPREERRAYSKRNEAARRRVLAACLTLILGALLAVKYTAWAVGGANALFGTGLAAPRLLMPMGVSFFTFQTAGYLIDVYRGAVKAERGAARLALFCSFFPQMVQGPISRWGDLSQTLFSADKINSGDFFAGIQRIVLGFFKKLVIADRLLAAVRTVTADPETYHGAYAALGILLYAVTLYADFTGGIDIALGAARAMGVRLAENFDRPFAAASAAEYWRRWHITMGTWFRDYLFYPLSASRPLTRLSRWARGKNAAAGRRVPVYAATLTVWLATGAWHGASWNFWVWGLANGLVIVLSEECAPLYKRFHARFGLGKTAAYRAFAVVRTFCLMSLIRSLDIYDGVGTTFRAIGSIVTRFDAGNVINGGFSALGLTAGDAAVAAGAVLVLLVWGRRGRDGTRETSAALQTALTLALLMVTLVFGAYGPGYDAGQFIYNRF